VLGELRLAQTSLTWHHWVYLRMSLGLD